MIQEIKDEVISHAGKPWFPIFIGFLCALDTFIPVFPNDFLIAAAVIAQPDRWLYCTIAQTLGITIGSTLFLFYAYVIFFLYFQYERSRTS